MSFATGTCVVPDSQRATLASQIAALVGRLHPTVPLERRHDDRIAIPVLFRLTPLNADRQPIREQAAIVVGKNISRRGLSFYHEQPMPHRRAIIELAHPGTGHFSAEIDVTWCRFTRPGWYESGGRLIRSVSVNTQIERDNLPQPARSTDALEETFVGFGSFDQYQI